jgi:hypothetical protein
MTTKKSTPKIGYTTNLGMFKFSKVNRRFNEPVSVNRIKKISESMVSDGLLVIPITVTSKFIIVDGQHRVQAAKAVGCGVYFIVDETIANTEKAIFERACILNSLHKDWGKNEYINGLSQRGNENYQKLEEFRKEFPMFSLTECIMLLFNSGTKGIDKTSFARGKFQIVSYEKAVEWANNILSLKPYFEKGYNRSNFVRAIMTIVEKLPQFDFQRFYHKMLLNPSKMKLCGDKKTYYQMIEDIYNFKSRNDDRLYINF